MDTETAAVFKEAGVKLRQFIPVGYHHCLAVLHLLTLPQPPNGMIHLEKQSLY
jgi:hypothetical protein